MSSALAFARRVPMWAWLASLVVISTGIRFMLAHQIVAPWIMVDELVYSNLARSFADTGHFLLRGEQTAAYGFVYPALIAPAWALFTSAPHAYTAAKGVNSLLVSLAAVPAYLLARRVLSPWYAFGAAVLTLSLPMLLFTGMLMTENAFYAVFLLAGLATVMWLEKPDLKRTLWLIGAFLLAYLTRAQAVAILPALATAPFLVSGRKALREFRWFFIAGVSAVVLVVLVQVTRGASVFGVFGAYEVAGHAGYTPGHILRWLLYHWEELILSMGIVPFVALGILGFGIKGRPRAEKAFLATAVTFTFWLVLEVATFASEQSQRVEERNMFYVVPFFLIALLLWIERGCPRPRKATGVFVVLAVLLPTILPYAASDDFFHHPTVGLIALPAVSDTSALLPLWALSGSVGGVQNVHWVVLGGAVAVCLLFVFVPRRWALVLPVLLVAYFAVSQKPIQDRYHRFSIANLFQGVGSERRDWIDRAAGKSDVSFVWTGNVDKFSLWESEFFNRRVKRFYYTTAPLAGDLPEQQLTLDPRTGDMRGADGKVVRVGDVLVDDSIDVAGQRIARNDSKGLTLLRVNGPLRQVSLVRGLYPQDTWSGREVTYTRLGCTGGSVTVELQSDPSIHAKPVTVTASTGQRLSVGPTEVKKLRVPLRRRGTTCPVTFTVSPTVVPNVVTKGQNPDPRELGVHFTRFAYAP